MTAFLRVWCAVFGHAPEPGLNLKFSIRFHCCRCHRLVPGDLGRTFPKRKSK